MDDKRSAISAALCHWAIQEMAYKPDPQQSRFAPPTANEMRKICRGTSLPLWDYVVHHVRSESTIQNIKDNLKVVYYNRERRSEQKKREIRLANLRAKKHQLVSQIDSTRSSIENLKSQSEHIHKEISESNRDQQSIKKQMEEHEVKVAILESVEKKTAALLRLLSEYQSRISCRLNSFQSSQSVSTQAKAATTSETGASKFSTNPSNVRQQIEFIRSNISNALKFSSLDDILTDLDVIDIEIQNADSNNSTCNQSILSELSRLCSEQTYLIEKEGDATDIEAMKSSVIEGMKLEYITAHSPSNLLDSVESLLERQRLEHVQRYMDTERAITESESIDKQRTQLLLNSGISIKDFSSISNHIHFGSDENYENNTIANKLNATTSDKGQSIQYIRSLWLELCAEEASLEVSKSTIERLQQVKKQYESDLQVLNEKYGRIQELEADNTSKMCSTNLLMQQILQFRKLFDDRVRQLHAFIQTRIISPANTDQSDISECLNGSKVMREVSLFMQTPLLTSTPTEKEDQRTYNQLLNVLHLSAHLATENLVTQVQEMLYDVQVVEKELDYRNSEIRHSASSNTFNHIKYDTDINSVVKSIEDSASQVTKTQNEAWLPILESIHSQLVSAIDHCTSIKTICHDLLNQPAQHLVKWTEVEGKTFATYLSQWKILSETLRKFAPK